MRLNKTISVVCAALIALTTIIYSAVPAFASSDTTEETWVESTFDGIATALWNITGAALKSSYDTFVDGLHAVGWYYDADIYALVDPTSDCMYGLTVDGVLVRERSGGSSGRGRQRVDSADDVVIGTETFAEIIDRLNQQYGNTAKKYISLNTDIRWKTANADGTNRYFQISWYQAGTFCNQSTWSQVYMLPFYYDADNDMMWYGLNQLHYTQTIETVDGVNSIYMDCEVTNFVDPDYSFTTRVLDGYGDPCDFAVHRYSDIIVDSSQDSKMNGLMGWIYNTYSEYIACYRDGTPACVTMYDTDTNTITKFCHLFSASDLASDIYTKNSWTGDKTKYCYPASSSYKEGHDIGYLVSNEPIKLGFDWTGIDPTKIDDDGTVSMGGTTINEYTITNSSGDSTTINEYVTNNYTYITNNNGDDSGSSDSGSTTGNVIVGGNVAVDGAIDVGGQVDININVNNSDSGTNEMPVEVDLNNYLEKTPEQAKPITEFLSIFFDFLPAELLGLICLGVAVAIILRIWGR